MEPAGVPTAVAVWPQHASQGIRRHADRAEPATDTESAALIEFAELPIFMALPFAAPPGLPVDRVRALGKLS